MTGALPLLTRPAPVGQPGWPDYTFGGQAPVARASPVSGTGCNPPSLVSSRPARVLAASSVDSFDRVWPFAEEYYVIQLAAHELAGSRSSWRSHGLGADLICHLVAILGQIELQTGIRRLPCDFL
jgi:hypothetical protein